MRSHYLVNTSLRIESKIRTVAELVDSFGEPDLEYEIGDQRSKKIVRLGLHESNGLIFNSKLDTSTAADAQIADLVQIAQRAPREMTDVDLKVILFVQTSGPHSIQLAVETLELLANNRLNFEISFD